MLRCLSCLPLVLLVPLSGCAAPRAERVPGLEECLSYDAGVLPDGRTIVQAYDSLFEAARRGTRPRNLVLAPFTRRPRLMNQEHTASLLQSLYPPGLRRTGAGGRVEIAYWITPAGLVRDPRLLRGSGHGELDQASLAVVSGMHFSPARNRDCPVPFFVVMPIQWRAHR